MDPVPKSKFSSLISFLRTNKRLIPAVVLFAAIPLTLAQVFISQDTRQRAASLTSTTTYSPRVLTIGFNPTDGTTSAADKYFGWVFPGKTAKQVEDETYNDTVAAFSRLSKGKINYQLVKNIQITTFPRYTNGQTFTMESYGRCAPTHSNEDIKFCDSFKYAFDHNAWIVDNNICQLARENNIDEIWMMSLPYVMTYESFMISPRDGFYVNAPPVKTTACDKNYIVMNGNYNTPTNFLHNYGHRIESIMSYLTDSWQLADRQKYWSNFARWDVPTGSTAPLPTCGNTHFPANASKEYDYENKNTINFSCPDWNNFPNLQGITETINCTAWGCIDKGWQEHWFGALPQSEGEAVMLNKYGGQFSFKKDWWHYILFPENAIAQRKIEDKPPVRDLSKNLLGLWTFDESSGVQLLDTSGNNNTATAVGTTVVPGVIGNARRFSGSDSISVNDAPSLSGMSEFSISLWVKPEDLSFYDALFCKQTQSGPYSYCLFWVPEYQRAALRVNSEGGDLFSETNSVLRNTWSHIVATYRGQTGEMAVYVNGVLCSTCSKRISPANVGVTSANLVFGNRYGGIERLVGALDEVRFYNIALSPDEVKELYSNPRPTPIPTPTNTPTPTPTPTPTVIPTPTATQSHYVPSFSSISLPPGKSGLPYKGELVAFDADRDDTLTMTFVGLPTGLNKSTCTKYINQVSGQTFSCKIEGASVEAGNYPVKVTLSDDNGGSSTRTIRLVIDNKEPSPEYVTFPTAKISGDYSYSLTAVDENLSDILSITIAGLPEGLSAGNCSQSIVTVLSTSRKKITCPVTGRATRVGDYTIKVVIKDNHAGESAFDAVLSVTQ